MRGKEGEEGGGLKKLTRRNIFIGFGLGVSALGLGTLYRRTATVGEVEENDGGQLALSTRDMLTIQQLNVRYFYALDGLFGEDSANIWADTFTADGTFSLRSADGSVITQATGTSELISTYAGFPDVATTRHWITNLMITAGGSTVKGGCYILAMDIGSMPASIERTGLYSDQLVKVRRSWKFQSRTLLLDASSSPLQNP
jgi:hypothetical protein